MGAGKSGLAQALSIALAQQSVAVRWLYEMQPGNPVGRIEDASLPAGGPTRPLEQWRRFVDRWDRTSVAVIDGRLLNLNITASLQAGRSKVDTISSMSKVIDTLRYQRVLLVHLVIDDVRRHVDTTTATRNDAEWFFARVAETAFGRLRSGGGTSAGYGIIEQTQEVAKELVASFPGDAMSLSVQNRSWEEVTSAVFRRVGIEHNIDAVGRSAESLAGEFSLEMNGETRTVCIRETAHGYTLHGHPFSSHHGIDDPLHLIPDSTRSFHIRSMPVSLERVRSGSDRVIVEQKPWYPPWDVVEGVLWRI